jgi:hypothetical protein
MKVFEAHIDKWYIHCLPDDGGRISVLQYAGKNLLTSIPVSFQPPAKDYGEYETRAVYGYDDCFPTVDPCIYPGQDSPGRDHGELCWRQWQVEKQNNEVICSVECPIPKALFRRTLEFTDNRLKWKFNMTNLSESGFPFLHVMHALMPLSEIQQIDLPCFDRVIDERTSEQIDFSSPEELERYLMKIKPGNFGMFLLRNPCMGFYKVKFRNGLTMKVVYNIDLFPTLGIWWNHSGYPDEKGLRRSEFALEPIPGSSSNLEISWDDGIFLKAEPEKSISWDINWELSIHRP